VLSAYELNQVKYISGVWHIGHLQAIIQITIGRTVTRDEVYDAMRRLNARSASSERTADI